MQQLTVRSRDRFKYFLLKHDLRREVLEWKKGRAPFPPEVYEQACGVILRYFCGFDVVTVPAPSFHSYRNHGYPVWELAKRLRSDCGLPLRRLFPRPSGKTRKHYTGWRQMEIQDIRIEAARFVLVIDDIATTGHTMRITYESILRRGSFPCGLALA